MTQSQQLSYSDAEKAKALTLAQLVYAKIISEGNIDPADLETLVNNLIPTLKNEIAGVDSYFAQQDNSSRLAGTQSLNVESLDTSQFMWNYNYTPLGANKVTVGTYLGTSNILRLFLMDTKKPIFNQFDRTLNIDYSRKVNSLVLDDVNSQYIGSNSIESITIAGTKKTTYNVAAMGGDDVIRVLSETLGSGSLVNIFGGSGRNTYLISVDSSWKKLPSTIHIWDFDPSKDSIVFVSSNGINPNIQETKRTLFNATASSFLPDMNNGSISYTKNAAQASFFVENMYNSLSFYKSLFRAAQHELTGEGIPLILLDETNYSLNNPNRLFNSNVLRTSPTEDIGDIAQGNTATLMVSKTPYTQFSQIDSSSDHDLFKVHLTAGNSYVFTMNHKPDVSGDKVLYTSLVLKDAQGNSIIANSNILSSKNSDGNSSINYLALKDGDFYLDASGSLPPSGCVVDNSQKDPLFGVPLPTLKTFDATYGSNNAKYAISAVEIPHLNVTPPSPDGSSYLKEGNFDGLINRAGFKISLTAGDYVDVDFYSYKSSPNMQITDPNGGVVIGWCYSGVSRNITTFLAKNSGDYLLDFSPSEPVTSGLYYSLTTTKNRDIEGDKYTQADLSINTVITSNLFNQWDHDWFRVKLDANKKYQFDLHKASFDSNLNTLLTLRDDNGKRLAFNDDYVNRYDYNQDPMTYSDSQLIYIAKTSGNYYIDAASNLERSSGAYTLSYKVI